MDKMNDFILYGAQYFRFPNPPLLQHRFHLDNIREIPTFNTGAIVGESIIRVGEIGRGNTTKLSNQIIVALIQFYEKLAQTDVRKA